MARGRLRIGVHRIPPIAEAATRAPPHRLSCLFLRQPAYACPNSCGRRLRVKRNLPITCIAWANDTGSIMFRGSALQVHGGTRRNWRPRSHRTGAYGAEWSGVSIMLWPGCWNEIGLDHCASLGRLRRRPSGRPTAERVPGVRRLSRRPRRAGGA
ncbi:hypothetical protein U91I_00935 [alpha proteobacterium U9-1i]|nr:hypothetical protein U91I_00935 [alpha proteobacterium U9-1i]